jgi:hypothetical protein
MSILKFCEPSIDKFTNSFNESFKVKCLLNDKTPMYTHLVNQIKEKLQKHHELYRFPVKAELWEDIFDQCINSNLSNWVGGGHNVGFDVISENNGLFKSNSKFQNKSGVIDLIKQTLQWNGHRTTRYKSLSDKINFISTNHCDYYVMLARDKKDWQCGNKIYYLVIFSSDKIDYSTLQWSEKYDKKNNLAGWVGEGNDYFSAHISKSMSDQLWTTAKLSYIADFYKKIEIN